MRKRPAPKPTELVERLDDYGPDVVPIDVDRREGSKDLFPLLEKRQVPCRLTTLHYGDAGFIGNGPEGVGVPVGVELKTIAEILSCIHGGRFAGHQLPGLLRSYKVVYLIVEGFFRRDHATGRLMIMRGGEWWPTRFGGTPWMYRDMERWLVSMEMIAGLRVRFAHNRADSAAFLADLHYWWTGKAWDEHNACQVIDDQSWVTQPRTMQLDPTTVTRKMYNQLPGVSWGRSKLLEKAFPTMEKLMAASEEDIAASSKGIGEKMAQTIYKAIHVGEGR